MPPPRRCKPQKAPEWQAREQRETGFENHVPPASIFPSIDGKVLRPSRPKQGMKYKHTATRDDAPSGTRVRISAIRAFQHGDQTRAFSVGTQAAREADHRCPYRDHCRTCVSWRLAEGGRRERALGSSADVVHAVHTAVPLALRPEPTQVRYRVGRRSRRGTGDCRSRELCGAGRQRCASMACMPRCFVQWVVRPKY